MHDVSICGGMKALFNCTTDNDFLQWTINGVPLDAFTSSTTDGDCDNVTFKGSVFCFTSASDDSGEIVYISTASINILQTTDVSCSNGTHTKTHTVNLEGKLNFYSAVCVNNFGNIYSLMNNYLAMLRWCWEAWLYYDVHLSLKPSHYLIW